MFDAIILTLRNLPLVAQILLGSWIFTMLLMPTLTVAWGERARTALTSIAVLLQAGYVVTVLVALQGWRTTALVGLGVAVLAWGVEYLGSHTGFPFGRYHYTDRLQPQIGRVPALIPFAWLMMLPAAWAVGAAITGHANGPAFAVVCGLAFTAWDLFLDPQMVAWGLWAWPETGRPVPRLFGIPWTNYAGWFGASTLITLAVAPAMRALEPLLLLYAITWLLETVGQLAIWRLTGPGLTGAAAMGLFLVWALIRAGAAP